jgi:hypothetical protein
MSFKLNDITFVKSGAGNGALANGSDFISGLMFYNNSRPAAMLAALPGGVDNFSDGSVIQIFSPADAVAIGIDNTYSDETTATSEFTLIASGSTGNSATIKALHWTGTITLGTYTNLSSDSLTTFTNGLAAAINALTTTHGYSAVSGGATGVLTITPPKGLGIYPNNAVTAHYYTGTCTGTVDLGAGAATVEYGIDVVAGVASKLAIYYYHIQRYFAVFPNGTLYIGIFNTAGAAAFADISNMMGYSKGAIVQLGIWDDQKTFALASLTLIQTQVGVVQTGGMLLSSVVYAADIKAIGTTLTTLAGAPYDLKTLTAYNVSALIDNDGGAVGFGLFKAIGKSITSLGAAIGCIAAASVGQDIGNPIPQFNCDDGSEFDTLMFGDGTSFNSLVPANISKLNALNNNKYLFLSKIWQNGGTVFGSYYNDDWTAAPFTSDLGEIRGNRTIDRVCKNIFGAVVPVLKSTIQLNTDGTMTVQSIASLTELCGDQIRPLVASGDLAGDANNFKASDWVKISATQKINVAGKLIIAITLFENGVAHAIQIPISI